jgi:hypothetical protein
MYPVNLTDKFIGTPDYLGTAYRIKSEINIISLFIN